MIGWQEVILILAILLLVFGPTELPKIARELGKAWYEFNKASSGVIQSVSSPQSTESKEEDKLILEAARKLDLNTEGKTDEQLRKDIFSEILNKKENPS